MASVVQVRCPECQQRNRIPVGRLASSAQCGRCKHALGGPTIPVEVDSARELQAIIENSAIPVVVDFWASWCGPCRTVAPEIAKVAASRTGQWLVVKANTERDPGVGGAHNIRSIPTMAVFRGGKEVGRSSGARPAAAIEQFVAQTLI